MKRILLLSITFLVLITGVIIFNFVFIKEVGNNYFLQYKAMFNAPVSSTYTINLAYFIEKGKEDIFHQKQISTVKFGNSDITKISKFSLTQSDSAKKYHIRNITLQVEFSKKGNENIDSLIVSFNDGENCTYPIGDWTISISDEPTGNHLQIFGEFPVATSRVNGYFFSVKNISDSFVKLESIALSTDFNVLEKPITMASHENINKQFNINANKKLDSKYVILRPKVVYIYNNNKFCFYPPASIYGILSLTDEDIDREVKGQRK